MKPLNFARMEPKLFDDDDPPLSDVREFSISFSNHDSEAPAQEEQKALKIEIKSNVLRSPTDKYGMITEEAARRLSALNKKQLNARIEKWREMLPTLPQLVTSNASVLKERARKGIPDGLRMLVWPHLAETEKLQREQKRTFKQLVESESNSSSKQIELDVRRTFPNNEYFQSTCERENVCIQSLRNILHALSVCMPELGYCQGMNFVTASLLIVMNDENAFWILYSFLKKYRQIDRYIDPNNIHKQFSAFEKLIRDFFPRMTKFFQDYDIHTLYYAADWFMTLYSSVLPLQLLYRVWDIFLVEGEKTFFRCGLALLHFKSSQLTQCSSLETIVGCLRDKSDINQYDPDQFVSVMTKNFIFSKSKLNAYYLEFEQGLKSH